MVLGSWWRGCGGERASRTSPGQELVLGPLRMRRFFSGTLPSVTLSCTKCTKLLICVCFRLQGWVSLPCTRLYSCHTPSSDSFSCPRAHAGSGPLCNSRFGALQGPSHSPGAPVTFSGAGSALANCTASLCFYEHSARILGAGGDFALLCLWYLYEGCYPACCPRTPAAASVLAASVRLACLPQYQVSLLHFSALCCTWELPFPPLAPQVASYPTSDSVLALPVHSRDAADDFLLLGTLHLQCALRTGLLLYFLSVMHCFARALKLRKGSSCYNRTLRHARSSFRGASVWLALGAAACFVDGAASVRCPDTAPPPLFQSAESVVHPAPPRLLLVGPRVVMPLPGLILLFVRPRVLATFVCMHRFSDIRPRPLMHMSGLGLMRGCHISVSFSTMRFSIRGTVAECYPCTLSHRLGLLRSLRPPSG